MKARYLVAGAVALGALFLALPFFELKLLEQPSCAAYLDFKESPFDAAGDEDLKSSLSRAIGQGVLQWPKAPYVVITIFGGEVDFEHVIIATKSGDRWEVTEAGRPWKVSAKKLRDFQPLPTRHLNGADSAKQEKLLSERCLYREPRYVSPDPEVHFSLLRAGRTYDGTMMSINVNDGTRSHIVVQGRPSGFNGALRNVVVKGSRFSMVVN